jgi:hypothetical protein
MAINWISGFIIPIIEIAFIGGIIAWISYVVIKAFHNAWEKSFKFFFKYKIMRKKYPESTLKWILNCMDEGVGYYDAKKFLMIKMIPEKQIYETMWIYDQVIVEMKGGLSKDGREFKGSHCKIESTTATELPKHNSD